MTLARLATRWQTGLGLGLFLAATALAQTAPPAHFPPLRDSPGDRAYQELKKHLDYIYGHEIETLPDSVALPDPPREWPGMNRFEVLAVVRALSIAQVVLEYGQLDPADHGTPLWIRDVRGYKKANGWYGIRLNGRAVDESRIYFQYAGEQVNLRDFCTVGSRMVDSGISPYK